MSQKSSTFARIFVYNRLNVDRCLFVMCCRLMGYEYRVHVLHSGFRYRALRVRYW